MNLKGYINIRAFVRNVVVVIQAQQLERPHSI